MLRLVTLAIAWLLWSGHYTVDKPLIASFGLGSCLFVAWIHGRLEAAGGFPPEPPLWPRAWRYFPWLAWQVVKSNLHVARAILDPRLVKPRVLRVPADQKGERARVLYANSITLTPGTISCELVGDEIWVHALTEDSARDVEGGEMARRVRALEKD